MFLSSKQDSIVVIRGVPYKKHTTLVDANLPYLLSIDRNRNNLFFCINADEFSDQSFHTVRLDLDKGLASIVLGIRNGFASAVDQSTGIVYLGGSDGIYSYNYSTNSVDKPALVTGIDIFDMCFQKHLYFVDTYTQSLKVLRNGKQTVVPNLDGHLIHHFVVDEDDDLYFVEPTGLYVLKSGRERAVLLDQRDVQYRGAALDVNGTAHFIAQDGIYEIDKDTGHPQLILPLEKGLGLAFDKVNNIVYSNERAVITLIR